MSNMTQKNKSVNYNYYYCVIVSSFEFNALLYIFLWFSQDKKSSSAFHSRLKLISFTNPFLYSLSGSFRTAFMDLNLYWTKWELASVLVSFVLFFVSGYVF